MDQAAVEIHGPRYRLVVITPETKALAERHERVLGPDTEAWLHGLRRRRTLAQQLPIVLWPRADDPGVTAINDRPGEPIAPPSTLYIRAQVEPFVKSGFLVTGLAQPHEALAALAHQQGAGLAIVASLHETGGCLTFARQGRSSQRPAYLRWDADWARNTAGSGDDLARLEFVSALAPHLQQLLEAVPGCSPRILVCGTLPNLRPAMGPLSAEFGQPVDVLDHPWPGLLDAGVNSLQVDPATWQLVRALALSYDRWQRRR